MEVFQNSENCLVETLYYKESIHEVNTHITYTIFQTFFSLILSDISFINFNKSGTICSVAVENYEKIENYRSIHHPYVARRFTADCHSVIIYATVPGIVEKII